MPEMSTDCNLCQSGYVDSNIHLPPWRILRSAFLSGKYCRPLPMWRILPSAFLSGVYCCAPNHSRMHCSLCTSLAYIANYLPLKGRWMAIYARDVDRLQFMPEWLCGQQYTPTSLAYIAVSLSFWQILPSTSHVAYIAVRLPIWCILLCT